MAFADELRKKSEQAPKDEKDKEKHFLNEIYVSLKEGVLRCFLRKCVEEASRGETELLLFLDFIHIVGIVHEQERIFVNQSDYPYVEHIMKVNKKELTDYIVDGLIEQGFTKINVKVNTSRLTGYYLRISAAW